MSKLYCERRQILFREFQEAMGAYTQAVGELSAYVSEEEHATLKRLAEIAHDFTVRTRSAFEQP